MTFDISIIGYIAGACSAISQFPQAFRIIKTRDTHSISPAMYSIMTLGVVFWLLYGILLNDLPMILANGVALIPMFYILYIIIQNNRILKKH